MIATGPGYMYSSGMGTGDSNDTLSTLAAGKAMLGCGMVGDLLLGTRLCPSCVDEWRVLGHHVICSSCHGTGAESIVLLCAGTSCHVPFVLDDVGTASDSENG